MERKDQPELESCNCSGRREAPNEYPKSNDDLCSNLPIHCKYDRFRARLYRSVDDEVKIEACQKFHVPQMTKVGFVDGVRHRCNDRCSDLHTRRPWVRQGAFRFLDLPIEIRTMIYELLLIRGKVSLANNHAIQSRFGFMYWKHSAPKWNLRRVSKQIRAEAMTVLCSNKNTFFLGTGPWQKYIGDGDPTPLPDVKRLDCVFDFRDIKFNTLGIFLQANNESEDWGDTDDEDGDPDAMYKIDRIPKERKWEVLHDCSGISFLEDVWLERLQLRLASERELLCLDVSNCRCAQLCCRYGVRIVEMLRNEAQNEDQPPKWPRQIEIVGALRDEREKMKMIFQEHKIIPLDRVTFTNSFGCTCKKDASCDLETYIKVDQVWQDDGEEPACSYCGKGSYRDSSY